MSKNIVILFITAVMLWGCATTDSILPSRADIGAGDIQFSVSSTATYRYYKDQKQPRDFVVTVDGERGFYTYCATSREIECRKNTSELLLDICTERTGKNCRIFAIDGKVVWEDPGQWRNSGTVGMHFFVDHKGIRTDKL